ncbi:MAG: DNA repair protein [Nitrosarchaeum sp.]|jgi:N-glycosylase/DNA lyase|nr:DNA repair protein [Nitrosarchaeum sp.]MBP0119958.1 DNA repair protein [Nitrosarchaeum sp.]MBP0134786.1 DNA repair protein [Nitrosarchaeum sp.]MDW7641800.1 DNA repair protein [Nitrosarchaeum sp.]MSV26897.1 DNA repair protein [Nitrosarchaeum sp.]
MIDFSKINLENTINSGQVFLWKKQKEFWYGINGQDILKINNFGKITSYSGNKYDFFRNSDDIEKIIKSISKDKTTKLAVEKYFGLRLIRQDPFQCFISFIVSSNSNIQKIKSSLEKISMKFGKKIEFDNKEFYIFPEPKKIANATIQEIQSCGVGYRAKFILDAAKIVESKQIDFNYLKKINYKEAKEIILSVPGIGNKVADCILLFSLDKLEAFPLDRWMIRILKKYYLEKFQLETKTITEKQYEILHEKIIKHFGVYAGYAQQFLFKMERENYQKNWL